MRKEFAKALYEAIRQNDKVMLLVGDCGYKIFDDIRKDFPDNFINMGIAEQNMIGVAAGMAAGGYIPFVYTIIPFIVFRAYEQIRNDICYQNRNVKLVGVGGGGKYKQQGFTHHVEDYKDSKIIRLLPNIRLFLPATVPPYSNEDVKIYVDLMMKLKTPCYLRLD